MAEETTRQPRQGGELNYTVSDRRMRLALGGCTGDSLFC